MHRFPQLSFVHRLVFVHSAVHWPLDRLSSCAAAADSSLLSLAGFHFKQQAKLLFGPSMPTQYYWEARERPHTLGAPASLSGSTKKILICPGSTAQLLEKHARTFTAALPNRHALASTAKQCRRQGIFQLPQNPATLASLTLSRHGGISLYNTQLFDTIKLILTINLGYGSLKYFVVLIC